MKLLARIVALLAAGVAAMAQAQNLSIATGGTGGVYYPLGGGMAAVLSKYVQGMQATAEVTGGSVANLQLISTGKPPKLVLAASARTRVMAAGVSQTRLRPGRCPPRNARRIVPPAPRCARHGPPNVVRNDQGFM